MCKRTSDFKQGNAISGLPRDTKNLPFVVTIRFLPLQKSCSFQTHLTSTITEKLPNTHLQGFCSICNINQSTVNEPESC